MNNLTISTRSRIPFGFIFCFTILLASTPLLAQENTQNKENSSTYSTSVTDEEFKDTGVLWRGFRHVWSYNHRVNRLGSWVEIKDCDGESCQYEVGHSAASGSGPDKVSFREAYTELSAQNVGFHTGSVSFDVRGKEKKPGPKSQLIEGSEEVIISYTDLQNSDPSEANYAVVLNGFDLKRTDNNAEKFIRYDLEISKVNNNPPDPGYNLDKGHVSFQIRYKLLFNCESAECKGGGQIAQDVDYDLKVHYALVEGSKRALNVTHGSELKNTIQWDHCKNNKVKPTPFADEENFNDKWDNPAAFHPGNHMFCEDSEDRQIHHENYWKTSTIQGKSGQSQSEFSVGTVGVKSISLWAENGTHYIQFDNIIGGDYDNKEGNYNVRALPFWKEWSTRPGIHKKAALSYGHAGKAEVGVEPVLIQIRDGCKRGLVTGGGLHWPGGGKKPTTSDAKKSSNYQFDFGEHWAGYGSNGNICNETNEGQVDFISYDNSNPAFFVAHTSGNKTAWKEFQPYKQNRSHLIAERTADEPTQLRARLSDRYHQTGRAGSTGALSLSVEQSNEKAEIPLSGINKPFVTRNAGLFDSYKITPQWPTFIITPTSTTGYRTEVFLHNLTNGNTSWVGTSAYNGQTIKEKIETSGNYALETVFDGIGDSPTTAVTTFQVDKTAKVKKDLDWTIQGDWNGSGATRSFSYDWQSGEHPQNRQGWRLNVSTPDGGGVSVVSTPLKVHAFAEEFEAEVHGNRPVFATHSEVNGNPNRKGDRWPKGSYKAGGDYTLSIFACYNVIGTRKNSSGEYVCRSEKNPGVLKQIEQTIKIGDAYGPEKPNVFVEGLSREQGSGIGHVDYKTNQERLTFTWAKPADRGNSSVNISPSGISAYEIEVSANGGQTENIHESTFGDNLTYAEASGDQRKITYSFQRDGYHDFKIHAIDREGNKSPIEQVKLCINEPDCQTPAEKAVEAEEAKEIARNALAAQRIEGWLDRFVSSLEDGKEPGDIMPDAPDAGFDYGDPVPCKVCMSGGTNWMPYGDLVNVHVNRAGQPATTYHVLIQDGEIVRMGGSPFENPSMEVTLAYKTMSAIKESDQPLQLMTQVIRDRAGSSYQIGASDQPPPRQDISEQTSEEEIVTLIPRGGLSLPGVSSLGEVTGQAQSKLTGGNSVFTWGGSVEFGSRDGIATVRATGLHRKGKIVSTLQNDQFATTEINENFTALTADLVLRPIPRILVQPYAIGGFGFRNISYGGQSAGDADEGWKSVAQIGAGVDINIGTEGFFLGVEMIDYISNFSSEGSLRHDAFMLGTIGIPLF